MSKRVLAREQSFYAAHGYDNTGMVERGSAQNLLCEVSEFYEFF